MYIRHRRAVEIGVVFARIEGVRHAVAAFLYTQHAECIHIRRGGAPVEQHALLEIVFGTSARRLQLRDRCPFVIIEFGTGQRYRSQLLVGIEEPQVR